MSTLGISLLISIGVGVWMYYKFAKRTGSGNLKPAIIGGLVIGMAVFIILYLTLLTVLK